MRCCWDDGRGIVVVKACVKWVKFGIFRITGFIRDQCLMLGNDMEMGAAVCLGI